VNELIELCEASPSLRFPDASQLALPTYTNDAADGESIKSNAGSLTAIVLHAILVQQSKWYNTFAAAHGQANHLSHATTMFVSFGQDRCVPSSLMRRLGPRLMQFADLDEDVPQHLASVLDPEAHSLHQHQQKSQQQQQQQQQVHVDEYAIAVVGMAIKVAGADDVDEFSQMLRTDESQHKEIVPT
jgi:hypothetical protein